MASLFGKTVLVTGGTGSFGNTVVRKLLDVGVGTVRVFSRDEKKQEAMALALSDTRVSFRLGDVRDAASVEDALQGVDLVFHAAALKQVPSCEAQPWQAFLTNVVGTENVLRASRFRGVQKVVVLSTDKAVYPVNAMGLSKAMAEKLVVAGSPHESQSSTVVCATRYGNVMGSRGSVIPKFIEMLGRGDRLTVTDPRMTRFLMSLDESVHLVLHAFKTGQQGDLFVQRAPACSVGVLVEALAMLFGRSAQVRIVGPRPGEKLHETLVTREELARAEAQDSFLRILPAGRTPVGTGVSPSEGAEDYTSETTQQLTAPEVADLLAGLAFVQRALADNSIAS